MVKRILSYNRILFAQAMLFCMACAAYGQIDTTATSPRPRFFIGAFGALGGSLAMADLVIPGFSDSCGVFRAGSGISWRAGGLFELPLGDLASLQLRPFVEGSSGSLREPVPGDSPVRRPDGTIVPAVIDQLLDLSRVDLGLGLLGRFPISSRLNLAGGVALARTISATQTHRQIAVSPDDLLLVNNSREYRGLSGTIISTSPLLLSLEGVISYDLPVASYSTLSPELSFSIPLLSETGDGALRSFSLRIGAALRFPLGVSDPVVDSTPMALRPPTLVTSIVTDPSVVAVEITNYDSTEVLPLLNQIFFREGFSDLPERYRTISPTETSAFSTDALLGSALDVYYQILNIVGMRMRETLGATLTVNGYRNGHESDPRLSLRRAEGVKRYLVDVWKISSRRIKVSSGGLPPNPSREIVQEGFEENARVELIPSDPNITGPWVRIHTQLVATPPTIIFYPRVSSDTGVSGWDLRVDEIGKGEWKRFSGSGSPPDSIIWNWQGDSGALPLLPMRLTYTFAAVDNAGGRESTPVIPILIDYRTNRETVEYRENDTTIESYSLLLFNFDSPKVSESDEELLRAIAAGVGRRSRVRFIGFTDSLGDEGHNRELATMRAREAARIFEKLVPPDVTITVDENGGERERFPYNTPEGRSHCRTVFIEVRTPTVKDEG